MMCRVLGGSAGRPTYEQIIDPQGSILGVRALRDVTTLPDFEMSGS